MGKLKKEVLNNAVVVIDPSSSRPVSIQVQGLVDSICWVPDVMYETFKDINQLPDIRKEEITRHFNHVPEYDRVFTEDNIKDIVDMIKVGKMGSE